MAAVKDSIVGLYITYFNRAPDSSGLAYWQAQAAANGATAALFDISSAFAQNSVAVAEYPNSMTNTAFVQKVYLYALNRTPAQIDPSGQTYWEGRLASVSRSNMMVEFVNAVLDYNSANDTTSTAAQKQSAIDAQTMIQNKIQAGVRFAASNKSNVALDANNNPDTASAVYKASQDVMSGITQDPATLTAANTKVDNYVGINGVGGSLATSAYSVFSNQTSVNEGATATFKLNTTNIANGTVVNYTLSGSTITAADVVGGLTGSTTVNNNTATITVNLASDATTEGTESVTVAINGQTLGASSTPVTTINDTSLSPSGQAFTLTTGTDNPATTSGNETINGYFNTTTGAVSTTFNSSDTINGNAGTDTFNLTLDGAANVNPTFVAANFSGIESVVLTNTSANTSTIDLNGITGIQSIGSNNSTANVTFVNMGNAVNASLQNASTANAGLKIIYSNLALAGTADASTLTLNNAGTVGARPTVTLTTAAPVTNNLETLNIVSNGSGNWITLATDAVQTSLNTLNISGAANLNLQFADDKIITSATTINASTATGNVSIAGDVMAHSLGIANHNVTLGGGNDTVYMCAHLNSNDTIVGGSGIDTLGLMQAVTNVDMTNVSGMEVARYDVTSNNITQDVSISALANFNFEVVGFNTMTLNNLANNKVTTVVGSASTLTETLKDSSGTSDVLTVGLSNGPNNVATSLDTLTNITGLETLNLVSSGGTSTNKIFSDLVTATHVITGSSNLQVIGTLATNNVNASAFTGNLIASTGSSNDTIILGSGADTIDTGSGNDQVTLGLQGVNASSGADSINLGAGNDVLKFVGSSSLNGGSGSAAIYNGVANLLSYSFSEDLLMFSAHNADFSANSGATAYTGLAKGSTAQGLAAGNAMVLQNITQNATAVAASTDVSVIKLSTSVAFSSNLAVTMQTALGSASVTGLAVNGNYIVAAYDQTASKMLIATVNVGSDATLSAADFTADNAVRVIGVVNMDALDYANFGGGNLGTAF